MECCKADPQLFSDIFGDRLSMQKLQWNNERFLCHTCQKYLIKGKLPPMSAANGLQLIPVPDDVKLTDLENNLISRKILFQKIYRLPKSRIGAVKDKLVNVPISEEDIINTLQLLPRTPKEGGLIEVKLKRKSSYKNYHKQEFIDPQKVFNAIQFLKQNDNPHYQTVSSIDSFRNRCRVEDPEGFELLFGNEQDFGIDIVSTHTRKCTVNFVDDHHKSLDEIMDLRDYLLSLEEERNAIEEIEYREKDTIRKFQIDYDESVCLAEKYPEAFHD